jgi:mRNA interferase MazF
VEISAKQFNLDKDSVILLEQMRTIDKRRLKEKVTHLSEEIMSKVDEGVRISLGLIQL